MDDKSYLIVAVAGLMLELGTWSPRQLVLAPSTVSRNPYRSCRWYRFGHPTASTAEGKGLVVTREGKVGW